MNTNTETCGNDARLLGFIRQCETCEFNKDGNPLLCRCLDSELKAREAEGETWFKEPMESEEQAEAGKAEKPKEQPESKEPEETEEQPAEASEEQAESREPEKSKEEPAEESEEQPESKEPEKLEEQSAEEPKEQSENGKEEEKQEQSESGKAAGTRKKNGNKQRSAVAAYFLDSRRWLWHCALAAVLMGGAAYWFYSQPRFHDLTVELGTQTISVEAFMTEFADVRNVGIVTDLSAVDISGVGSTPLTLRSGSKDETVILTIEDTVPPEAEFISYLQKTPDYIPDPYDFVAAYSDLSEVNIYFVGNVVIPLNYEDQSITVVVEDAYGNAVSQDCILSIVWMKSEYTLELGETLRKEDLLYNPDRDCYRIRQEDIDAVNQSGTGEYTVASAVDECVCRIRVEDTTPPELIVTDVPVFLGEEVTVDSFVVSCTDVSGEVEVRLLTEPDVNTLGKQTMTIEATDINGNTATATAVLAVVEDKTPPVIKGLTTLRVEKRSTPDYLSGVSGVDEEDGICEVTYDASGVNLNAAGTYYVTYTSKDRCGNTARVKRTVVVEHDQEDTDALADSIAAGLGDDPEAIRDYIRDTIKYSHNSGGKDPVWYGFTNKSGDCLVHALCLQSILTRKNYETQLIWVTDRSHYWLIIHLDGVWRHIDATPGRRHTQYSLMTDAQRYAILQGRDWDRSAWPACE